MITITIIWQHDYSLSYVIFLKKLEFFEQHIFI